jgi:shikimate kinase
MFDLQGLNVYLVGMMGTGKTTIAPILARVLEYGSLDLDRTIAKAAQKTIPEIFTESGEAGFREIETQILQEVCAFTRLVISTGGGVVTQRRNWSYLQQGLVIWLDVSPPVLIERLRKDTSRPILGGLQGADLAAKVDGILADRRNFYAQADLHISISAGDTPEAIVERIITTIPAVLS